MQEIPDGLLNAPARLSNHNGLHFPTNPTSPGQKIVSDTVRFLTWLRNLPANKETELLIHEGNQMAKAVRDYRIPAYIVRTDDEKTLREIFERLNKGGKPLTDGEVFERSDGSAYSVSHKSCQIPCQS